MMMRPGDILGRIFLCCHRNQSSDHRDLSTEHTEDTDHRNFIHGAHGGHGIILEVASQEIFGGNL